MMCKQSLESSMSHQLFNHVASPAIPFSSLHKCALGWGQELTCSWLHFVCYSKAEGCAVKSVCELLKPVGMAPIHTAWLPLRVCSWCLLNPSFTPGSKLEVIYPCARMKQGDLCLFFFHLFGMCVDAVCERRGGGERRDLEPLFAPFLELGQLIHVLQVLLRVRVPVSGLWWWCCLGWEIVLNSKMEPKGGSHSPNASKREKKCEWEWEGPRAGHASGVCCRR